MRYRIGGWTYERGNVSNLLSGSRCWTELKCRRADWLPAGSFCTLFCQLCSSGWPRSLSLFTTESPPFSCFGWIAGKFFSFMVPRRFFPVTLASSRRFWSCQSTPPEEKCVFVQTFSVALKHCQNNRWRDHTGLKIRLWSPETAVNREVDQSSTDWKVGGLIPDQLQSVHQARHWTFNLQQWLMSVCFLPLSWYIKSTSLC